MNFDNALKLLRVYTPFILTLAALISITTVLFIDEPSFSLVMSELFGGSIFLDIYLWITSRKMCIYYKTNILCLGLTHVSNILYDYFLISDTLYLITIIILLMLGTISFIIFKRRYIIKLN
jgi:hypothetical protein